MGTSGIERVIDRAVDTFEKLFTVFAFHKVVVTDAIEHRAIHIGCVHQFDMGFQAVIITNITGVNNESGLFISDIVADVVHPVTVVFGVEDLSVGDMHVFMATVFLDATVVGLQSEVIRYLVAIDSVVMLVVCLISGRGRDKDKTFTVVTGKGESTVGCRLYDIQAVGDGYTCHRFFAFIKDAVVVLVYKYTSCISGTSRECHTAQQGDVQKCLFHVS